MNGNVSIHQNRGAWTASVDGFGNLPVVWKRDLDSDGVLSFRWVADVEGKSRGHRVSQMRKSYEALVHQLGATNPHRRVNVVVADRVDGGSPVQREVWEFEFGPGSARLDDGYSIEVRLTDGRRVI